MKKMEDYFNFNENDDPKFTTFEPGTRIRIMLKPQFQEGYEEQMFVTRVGRQMNHLYEGLMNRISPNDCRFRPDLRALDFGNEELSAQEKQRLEESQRARRRGRKERNESYRPNFFDLEEKGKHQYRVAWNSRYFKMQESGNWSGLVDIYN